MIWYVWGVSYVEINWRREEDFWMTLWWRDSHDVKTFLEASLPTLDGTMNHVLYWLQHIGWGQDIFHFQGGTQPFRGGVDVLTQTMLCLPFYWKPEYICFLNLGVDYNKVSLIIIWLHLLEICTWRRMTGSLMSSKIISF